MIFFEGLTPLTLDDEASGEVHFTMPEVEGKTNYIQIILFSFYTLFVLIHWQRAFPSKTL
jgi:hypothetical protein